MQNYYRENNKECPISKKFYLCWTLIGLPIVVGPLIAIARFLRAFSGMCAIYNSNHTFPLTEDEIKAEEALMNQPKPKKRRKSLIEQIHETIIVENEEEVPQDLDSEQAEGSAQTEPDHENEDSEPTA